MLLPLSKTYSLQLHKQKYLENHQRCRREVGLERKNEREEREKRRRITGKELEGEGPGRICLLMRRNKYLLQKTTTSALNCDFRRADGKHPDIQRLYYLG